MRGTMSGPHAWKYKQYSTLRRGDLVKVIACQHQRIGLEEACDGTMLRVRYAWRQEQFEGEHGTQRRYGLEDPETGGMIADLPRCQLQKLYQEP